MLIEWGRCKFFVQVRVVVWKVVDVKLSRDQPSWQNGGQGEERGGGGYTAANETKICEVNERKWPRNQTSGWFTFHLPSLHDWYFAFFKFWLRENSPLKWNLSKTFLAELSQLF